MSTPSLRPLTNRDFKLPDDGYYHILPPGTHPHPSGLEQVVDAKSFSAIMNAFADDKAKKEKVEDDGILLADYDHFSNDSNQKSEAAGWIEDFQKRDDGIYAKIRWSDEGLKDVKGGVYRYVSPVWNRADCEDLGDKKIRPLRIDRVGLTNDPNIKGMRPLSNRSAEPVEIEADPVEEMPFFNSAAKQDDEALSAPRAATTDDL